MYHCVVSITLGIERGEVSDEQVRHPWGLIFGDLRLKHPNSDHS